MHPWAAVAARVRLEDPPDASHQLPVLLRMRALRAAAPGIVARARHSVAATETRHAVRPARLRALRVDEGEDFSLRAEQNRMAFSRSSCSSLRMACSFSSAWSLAISRAGPAGGAFPAFPRSFPSRASLPPLREHERGDGQCCGLRLYLDPRLLAQAHGGAIELVTIAADRAWACSRHETPPSFGRSVHQSGASSTVRCKRLLGRSYSRT